MFVAVYRWRLAPGSDERFRAAWTRATQAIRAGCGSHGSSLFRSEDGWLVGIACWPSRERWERCSAASAEDLEAMQACIIERGPTQLLQSEAMLWALPDQDAPAPSPLGRP